MKKLFLSIAAIVVLLAACSKEQNTISSAKENLVTYTFTATSADDSEVRSTLSNDGVFSWVKDDQIAIYNSTTSSYVTFTVTAVNNETGEATITADAAPGAVWTNAIYPAARAAGSGNQVDYTVTTVAGPILVSQVSGQTLSFKYLGAVANIQVNSVPDTPTTLTFTAKANVFGNRTFTWDNGSPVLGGTGSQATVTVPFNTSGITSVPIPQTSYAGFTITVDNEAGRHLYKKTTSKTFDLSSKRLLSMKALTYSAPTEFYVTTSSNTHYWDKSNVRMIQTEASKYEVQMNCDGSTTIYIFDNYNTDNYTVGYLSTSSVNDGNFYQITWNSSTSKGGPTYISATRNYPFTDEKYPVGTNEMCLSGEFNSWGHTQTFTYNGNHYWTLEGLEIEEEKSYGFKIKKAEDGWSYAAGINLGLGTTSLYGSLKGNANNSYVTLAVGTYNVYLNATSDWYYNIMFVKQ